MSEPVLKSIIQLMAISATVDGVISDSERSIINDFIRENLNQEYAKAYISLFNDYAEIALAGNVEASNICKRINLELNQKQKIIVLFHLLELANVDGKVAHNELEFVQQVANFFNIDETEYYKIRDFVLEDDVIKLGLNNVLVISGQKFDMNINQIYRAKFPAMIGILRIPNVEMYMLKYLDTDSKSNTFLNGILLKDRHIYTFSNGSSIRNELITPIYYSDVVGRFLKKDQGTIFSFEARHLYYTFPGGKIGLRDINVAEESGKLIGIMGSSGSGKSTLLNVMNGNQIPIGGKVTINTVDVHDDSEKEKIKGAIGYVPQDDLLIEELTVFQNLYYAAKLCNSKCSEQQIRDLVMKTLVNLGLSDIADLKVGNPLQKTISGGQRKRLNIGLELLREPSVLFIDEPTSGLSSHDSENIMDLLKELSLKGKLLFVVIHQPSSDIFKMFDKLIILDVGGYQIYYGNPIEGVIYFRTLANQINSDEGVCNYCGNVNPEQIFQIIETKVVDEYGRYTNLRKVSAVQWRKYFEENYQLPKIKTVTEEPHATLNKPSKFKQWLLFAQRDMLSKLSNTQYMVISLLEAPLLAFILAYIVRYYEHTNGRHTYVFSENMNIPAYLFMSIIVALFVGMTVSAEEIIKDGKILKRESFLHLSRTSYLVSKITILFAFSAVQTLSFVLIGNWILGIKGMLFNHWIVLFSTACFANMLGLNISSTFSSVITVYILIPIMLIPQLILGGIVVKFDDINPQLGSDYKVPIVSEIMASRWAFEAMMVTQFKDNEYEKQFYEMDRKMAEADYKKIYYIPTLESSLSYCTNNITSTDQNIRKVVDKNILLLQFELNKESKNSPSLVFKQLGEVSLDSFNPDVAKEIKDYLNKLKRYYVRQFNNADREKNNLISKNTNTRTKRDAFIEKARMYHNNTVADLVTNANETVRIAEINGRLIQKIYPVYHSPEVHNGNWFNFRTHFYAPQKYIFSWYMDTLWFNILMIWLMSIILYTTLYYKIFNESFKVFAALANRRKKRIK